MNSFSVESKCLWDSELASSLVNILGMPIISAEKVLGGHNSRVYSVEYGTSDRCVVKFYPSTKPLKRDRLSAEYSALCFLRNHGVERVPEPLGMDNKRNYAVYSYIDGSTIKSSEVSSDDINQAVNFLILLKDLADTHIGSKNILPQAAESCFSVKEIIDSIRLRLNRLQGLQQQNQLHVELQEWLKYNFVPSLHIIEQWCTSRLSQLGLSLDSQLNAAYRTLSPSDFGFHNAIRYENGQIIFLDFEYFGWDNPSKMLADFLLHPAMSIGQTHRQKFWDGILEGFRSYEDLATMTEIEYPLWGLKWCSIMLNEFDPNLMGIREFANETSQNVEHRQVSQLKKARAMLEKIMSEYHCFPYG